MTRIIEMDHHTTRSFGASALPEQRNFSVKSVRVLTVKLALAAFAPEPAAS